MMLTIVMRGRLLLPQEAEDRGLCLGLDRYQECFLDQVGSFLELLVRLECLDLRGRGGVYRQV